jgi:hypothetical protein
MSTNSLQSAAVAQLSTTLIMVPNLPLLPHPSLKQSLIDQIKHSLTLDPLPYFLNLPRRLLTNRSLPNPSKRLLQLLQRRRANDNPIPIFRLERTVVLYPPVRKIRFRRVLTLRHGSPLLERFEEAGLVKALVVSFAVRGARSEAAFTGGDVGDGFGEEATGEGGVGVEALDACVSVLGRLAVRLEAS